MRADPRFARKPLEFWAHVRSISEQLGYVKKGKSEIRSPGVEDIAKAMKSMGFEADEVPGDTGAPSELAHALVHYFAHRAKLLNDDVRPLLMDADEAESLYAQVRRRTRTTRPPTLNKQKGAKRKPAFLTEIVRMTIESRIGDHLCDFDPRRLTAFSSDGRPWRTLSRRLDGAFPSVVDPVAVWEIKEYYHTTTFGSRVADGVYETALDGMELAEMRRSTDRLCAHLLVVDGRYTWWKCGRSYLCRLVDMLHMGYVDEILFGKEVVSRLPDVVDGWVRQLETSIR